NTERIVILQIESPEALENVDEICSVPGFDGILFGPGDFSHRIGKAGQIDAPEVVDARKRVGAATRKHGKFAMTAGLIAPLAQLVEEGYRVINIGADVVALTGYVKQRLDLVRGLINELPEAVRPPVRSPYA
ncbi:MAG: aldolase/citrate lyase family protein, partial [Opitutaceae bacterium]